MSSTKLKVLTLNCWGVFVPVLCKDRSNRILSIGNHLAKGEYDIILLQEIWTESDYNILCQLVFLSYPYSHYFYSGLYGSGVCIFSKYPIIETSQFRYSLNGYPHKLSHGDYFGGKSVGLAKILVKDFRINVYATHLHAQYYKDSNDYMSHHRLAQAFELAQYIKLTSETCDAVILGGDFNTRDDQEGYKIITLIADVKDSWLVQKNNSALKPEATFDRPDNVYAKPTEDHPLGLRIDYLMHRNNSGIELECQSCKITMGKIPEHSFNFSDHEGVEATYIIRKNLTSICSQIDSGELEKCLLKASESMTSGLVRIKSARFGWLAIWIINLFALTYCCYLSPGYQNTNYGLKNINYSGQKIVNDFWLDSFLYLIWNLLRVLLTLSLGFVTCHTCIFLKIEMKHIESIVRDMNYMCKRN